MAFVRTFMDPNAVLKNLDLQLSKFIPRAEVVLEEMLH